MRELEERFGGRWRYTSALRQWFYVRRKLVRWVEARAAAAQVSLAVVAAAMDRLGPSPDRFLQGIGQGRGSPCERSTRIDLSCIPFLPKSTSI